MAEEVAGAWFCYMVDVRMASFYVGDSNDVGERIGETQLRVLGRDSPRSRRPVELVWQSEICRTFLPRAARENEIEGLEPR